MKIAAIVMTCLSGLAALGSLISNEHITNWHFMLVIGSGVPAIVLSNLARENSATDKAESQG